MKTKLYLLGIVGVCLLSGILVSPSGVFAHCDTLEGPVVQDARTALETGEIYPVLKWVSGQDEEQIRSAFKKNIVCKEKRP